MKNMKVYDENLRKKVGTIALSFVLGVTSLGFTGCSKEKAEDKTSNEIVYIVEKDDEQKECEKDTAILTNSLSQNVNIKNEKFAEYDRYVDLNHLSDLDLDKVNIYEMNNQENDNYLIDYVYTVRDGGYLNTYMPKDTLKQFLKDDVDYDNYTTATFNNSEMIMPYPYKWAEGIFGNGGNREKTDEAITIEELYGINGNHYLYYDYTVVANQKISAPFEVPQEYIKEYGFPEPIKEGDYIHYEGLYLANNGKLELLANKQTGIGSDSENVKKSLKGNLDDVLKPISSLENAKPSEEFEDNYQFDKFVFGKTNAKVRVRVND